MRYQRAMRWLFDQGWTQVSAIEFLKLSRSVQRAEMA